MILQLNRLCSRFPVKRKFKWVERHEPRDTDYHHRTKSIIMIVDSLTSHILSDDTLIS